MPLVPSAADPPRLNAWGTDCPGAHLKPTVAQTSSFPAPQYLRIYLSGYPDPPSVALQRVSDGSKYLLSSWDGWATRWQSYDFSLPQSWQGEPVRLVVENLKGANDLALAFSEPLAGSGIAPAGDATGIFTLTLLHFCALFVGALALTAVGLWLGVRDLVQAGLITLAGTAVPGYGIFWLTLLSPHLGRYASVLALAAAGIGLVFCFTRLDQGGRRLLLSLWPPVVLTGSVALLVLSAGFVYGGWRDPIAQAAQRFSHPLPPDNQIPYLLAKGARAPQMPKPLLADWLSSDRPPLQAGIVLSQFPLLRNPREQGYQALSVLLQSLWIFALWLLLTALRLKSRAIVLVLAVCLFSGFVFINSFYVWPKMLAAAYALGVFAAFAAPDCTGRSFLQSWILPGVLLSFSLLSHGGSLFGIIVAVPILCLFRRPWQSKRLLLTILFALVLYLPWMLYQKLYDPPGDRLLKYHLAGVQKVDQRPFLQVLASAYRPLSSRQILNDKLASFDFAVGNGLHYLENGVQTFKDLFLRGGLSAAARDADVLRADAFFFIVPTLGFLSIAPCALVAGIAKRFRSTEWRTAGLLWIVVLLSIAVWCVLMFERTGTVIHQGSYATVLLAMAAAVLSLWGLSPRLAFIVCLFQIGLNFLVYGILLRIPYPNGIVREGIVHFDTLLLCLVSIGSVLALFRKLAQDSDFRATEIS